MLSVQKISEPEHLGFVRSQRSASFLQTPAWGRVKSEWRRESLGWFRGGSWSAPALVLYRQLPRVKRYLAYLPEGPVIDWAADDLAAWLDPMAAHLKKQGAFGVRMGPPVVTRRWSAARSRRASPTTAYAGSGISRPPSGAGRAPAWSPSSASSAGGQQAAEGGFAAGQPQFIFQIPLHRAAPRTTSSRA